MLTLYFTPCIATFTVEAINSDSFKNSLAVLREKKIISNDVCNIQVLEPDQLAILKSTIQLHLKIFKSA